MTELRRAKLVPFDEQGQNPDEDAAIELDFNPETLTIRVQNTLQDSPGQRGRQRRQFVGSSSSTLTFDAIFDSTRPKNLPGEEPEDETPEGLDVRRRTRPIAEILQVANPSARHPAPKRVEFRWGTILFQGVIDSFSEVLEYFSPEGVPLRSKVSLSLKEQKFEYNVSDDERSQAQLAGFNGGGAGGSGPTSPSEALSKLGAGVANAGAVAAQNGLDSLLDIGLSGSLSFDASLSLGASVGLSASVDVGLDLGVGVDLGVSAGASLEVSASAALEVFGSAAVSAAVGGSVDLSATSQRAPSAAPPASPGPRAPWAPEGPAPGSRASGLSAIVNAERSSGAAPELPPAGRGAFTATAIGGAPASRSGQTMSGASASAAPVPVRGSPPRVASAVGAGPAGAVLGKARFRPSETASLAGARPRWEAGPSPSAVGGASPRPCCPGCGARSARPSSSSWGAGRGGSSGCGCGGR